MKLVLQRVSCDKLKAVGKKRKGFAKLSQEELTSTLIGTYRLRQEATNCSNIKKAGTESRTKGITNSKDTESTETITERSCTETTKSPNTATATATESYSIKIEENSETEMRRLRADFGVSRYRSLSCNELDSIEGIYIEEQHKTPSQSNGAKYDAEYSVKNNGKAQCNDGHSDKCYKVGFLRRVFGKRHKKMKRSKSQEHISSTALNISIKDVMDKDLRRTSNSAEMWQGSPFQHRRRMGICEEDEYTREQFSEILRVFIVKKNMDDYCF
eukprot:gene6337-7063_t